MLQFGTTMNSVFRNSLYSIFFQILEDSTKFFLHYGCYVVSRVSSGGKQASDLAGGGDRRRFAEQESNVLTTD